MFSFFSYDLYIFDCDGVILDSNKSKINAMRYALNSVKEIVGGVEDSVRYFSENFGKSRYHHVDYFINNTLALAAGSSEVDVYHHVLEQYALQVDRFYRKSSETQHIREVLSTISGLAFVASGSEESQLKSVLYDKGLHSYFADIYGSPTTKEQIVDNIMHTQPRNVNALMIGDALADFEVAHSAGIDFLGITRFSNVPLNLRDKCIAHGDPCIKDWSEIIKV